jgi:hypothetical protein
MCRAASFFETMLPKNILFLVVGVYLLLFAPERFLFGAEAFFAAWLSI